MMLEELKDRDPLRATVNRGLAVSWINGDLFSRCHHDIRKSWAVYDEDKDFVGMLMEKPSEELQDRLYRVGVRYYSKGVK